MKLNPKEEWKIIKRELYENKSDCNPFPEHIVKRRELLLMAQCVLADYQTAKSKNKKICLEKFIQKL